MTATGIVLVVIAVAVIAVLAWYLVRQGSVSANKLRAARWQWHIYRDIEKLGLAASTWYMGYYVWHAVNKRRTKWQVPRSSG